MKIDLTNTRPTDAARIAFATDRIPEIHTFADKMTEARRFDADADKVKAFYTHEGLCVLIGRPKADDVRHIAALAGDALRLVKAENAKSLVFELDSYDGRISPALLARTIAESLVEADYAFTDYVSNKSASILEATLISANAEAVESAVREGELLGRAVVRIRGVVNRTSRDMTPSALAAYAEEIAKETGCAYELLDAAALASLHADALLSVALGSNEPALMAVLRYRGDPDHPNDVTALIGKGITFDSGGLSLKSKTGMITMHHDMNGAAVAAAVVGLTAQSKRKINLTAVLPICGKMLSAVSYRPGDVIKTMNGKSVLIISTDAEGRLVMADALTYAIRHENASRLIDAATLTGGAASAYGPLVTAFASTCDALTQAVKASAETSGELAWEMPLVDDYKSFLKADNADIANSSNNGGSSMINAAIFLKEFTEGKPWLHLDCAGTAWTTKEGGRFSAGATGTPCALLYDLMKSLSAEPNK